MARFGETPISFLLPDGREVSLFRNLNGKLQRHQVQVNVNLKICPYCLCDNVQPVRQRVIAKDSVEAALRCPDCHIRYRICCDGGSHKFFVGLNSQLLDELRFHCDRVTQSNMLDALALMQVALDHDVLLPEDF